MAQANIRDVFNKYVVEFNEANKNGDVDTICDIGPKLISIAADECISSSSNKNAYRSQIDSIVSVLIKYMKKNITSLSSNKGTSSEDDPDGDPYYSKKQWFSSEVPDLNFTNIIGLQDVKDAFMTDVVAPLRPEFKEIYKKFRGSALGVQLLLYGPPGTGKTHIVKCLAGALNCQIAVVQTSEVLASLVGVAEKNMRDIFKQASELDRCIIFLDEIDSICSDRESDDSRHTKSILTTMLTCMDGFLKTTKEGQLRIIVAATNLPWKLDSALKRGGRFDTQIYVPLPDLPARRKFVQLELDKVPHADDVSVDYLAERFNGFAGADIKAAMKQMANEPLRREVLNVMHGKGEQGEILTKQDCEKVLRTYINSVSTEMLQRFKAYNLGISYEDYLLKLVNRSKK